MNKKSILLLGLCVGLHWACKSTLVTDEKSSISPESTRVAIIPSSIQGVNWADSRDNFVDDKLLLSGTALNDSYTTIQTKGTPIVDAFLKIGVNTIRIPLNPPTVLDPWWNSYTGAIDLAISKGMKVILCPWEGNSSKDGKVDNLTLFWNMWQTVINKYGTNEQVLFEVFNEPHGYTATELKQLYASFLTQYSTIPKDRILLGGRGYCEFVTEIASDNQFAGCLFSFHDYSWFGSNVATTANREQHIQNRVGSYASRTVVTEFGTSLTNGKNYLASPNGDVEIAYLQGITNKIQANQMGGVYWPGLRNGDSYSLYNYNGSTMNINNVTALAKIQFAWNSIAIANNATYKITSANSNKVLDINGGVSATNNGAKLQQWTWSNTDNQKWLLQSVEAGIYRITPVHSGKALDVNGGETATQNGPYLNQWDYYGGANQKFAFAHLGNGNFAIIAKHSGKVLDVSGASTANGADIIQWQYSGESNQLWKVTQ